MVGGQTIGGYNLRDFAIRAVLTFSINIILLLISSQLPELVPGANVRIAAFVPIVFGIIWGLPAAIGVALSNMVSDTVCGYDSVSIVFGGLINGLAALLAYRLFYMVKLKDRNIYIYDTKSLVCFFGTTLITEWITCVLVSMLLVRYSGVDPFYAYRVTFCNNMLYAVMLGLLAMLAIPGIKHRQCVPRETRTERIRYVTVLFLMAPAVAFFMYYFGVYSDIAIGVLVSVLLLSVFVIWCPRVTASYRDDVFRSLKYKGFKQIMGMSAIVSAILISLMAIIITSLIEDRQEALYLIYIYSAFILGIITISFTVVQGIVERNITNPMYAITSHLRTDDDADMNEMEVLKDRLDFASELTEDIGGNEYRLYIGLTTKDGITSLDPADVMPVVDDICLRHVGGYMSSSKMVGGYRGKDANCKENVLVYTIYGATDEQIKQLVMEVAKALDQESIMIEKNRVARWYHGDGTVEDAE